MISSTAFFFWKNFDKALGTETIKDFAKRNGLDYVRIVNQRSDNRLPKLDDALSLARSLGTSVEYLLTGEDTGAHYSRTVAEIADHLMTLPLDRVLMIRDMVMALEGSTSTSEARKA